MFHVERPCTPRLSLDAAEWTAYSDHIHFTGRLQRQNPAILSLDQTVRRGRSVPLTRRLERDDGPNVRNNVKHLVVGQFAAVTVHRGEQDAVGQGNQKFPIGFRS